MNTRSPPGEFGLSHIPLSGNDQADRQGRARPPDDVIPGAAPNYRSPRRLVLWTVSLSTALWGLSAMIFFWWVH